jgi:hypothetical protein
MQDHSLESEKQKFTTALKDLLETHKKDIAFSAVAYEKKPGQLVVRYDIVEDGATKLKDLNVYYDINDLDAKESLKKYISDEFTTNKAPLKKTRQRNTDIKKVERPTDLEGEKTQATNDIEALNEKYKKRPGGITFAGPYERSDKIMIRYTIVEGTTKKAPDVTYKLHEKTDEGKKTEAQELKKHIKSEFTRLGVQTVHHMPGPAKGTTLGSLPGRGHEFTPREIKKRKVPGDIIQERKQGQDPKRVQLPQKPKEKDPFTIKVAALLEQDQNTTFSNLKYVMSSGKLTVYFNTTSDGVTEPDSVVLPNLNNEQQKAKMSEISKYMEQLNQVQVNRINSQRGSSGNGDRGR